MGTLARIRRNEPSSRTSRAAIISSGDFRWPNEQQSSAALVAAREAFAAMREQVNLGSKGLAIAISVAINRSRGRTERSPTLLSRSSHGGGNVCLRPIRGASGDDIIGTIVEFLSSTPSCIVCLVERTGLRAWDVETAMRVLIRTSEVELAGVCERCRVRNAFRARPRGRTGSCV